MIFLKVKKILPNAKKPEMAHYGDLGYDLFAAEKAIIRPQHIRLVRTGICLEFPGGWGGKIFDRSSVSTKQTVFVQAGVVDNGYRGEILVAMYNGGHRPAVIEEGSKIAQLVPMQTVYWNVIEVNEFESNTSRGEKGFGSSGE